VTIQHAVRPPAVAGRFYPDDSGELEGVVRRLLDAAAPPAVRGKLVGLVAPHAGYVYSGPVAASAYALLASSGVEVRRVVLLGPSHFVAFEGLALPECDALCTPLGEHPLDDDAVSSLMESPFVRRWSLPHRDEHSLEVQLPFIHVVLGAVPVVPLVTGIVRATDVADALDAICTDATLLVVSSDLSHYLTYDEAQAVDVRTADAIQGLRPEELGSDRACGVVGLRGLLELAGRRGLRGHCVDLRNSGDTYGPRNRVVGYGAFAFCGGDA